MHTNSFLNVFYRMVNRGRLPLEVLSDNKNNIVRGNTELKEFINNLEKYNIRMSTDSKGIKWYFNALLGSDLGGVFETMIEVAK